MYWPLQIAFLEMLGAALALWVIYLLAKLAVKHGIEESGLIEVLRRISERDKNPDTERRVVDARAP